MLDALLRFGVRQMSRGRLTVLAFHGVPTHAQELPPDVPFPDFVKLLDFVDAHFNVIPLGDAVSALERGRLPPHAACLTFDDGYASWLEGVAPELRRRNMHATFYITTGQFEGLANWHERLASALTSCVLGTLSLRELGIPQLELVTVPQRKEAYRQLESLLKYQPIDRREAMLDLVLSHLGGTIKSPLTMSVDQLKAIHQQGFGIGAHTRTHPILSMCSEEVARREIMSAKADLQDILGCQVDAFAYPNGRPGADFTAAHVRMVQEAGYAHAVTTGAGAARVGVSRYEIPRFTPWGPGQTKMRAQMMRNYFSSRREQGTQPRHSPLKVLLVENGAGFGGAVVAARNLIEGSDPKQVSYVVVSNLEQDGLRELPATVAMRELSDRVFDARKLTRQIDQRHWPASLAKALKFAVGRADDVFNRWPYLIRLWAYARKLQPDIIHGNNDPGANREAMWVAKALNKRYVQHVRGELQHVGPKGALLGGADAFVPVSRWLAVELFRQGVPADRVRQVYDSVSVPDVHLAPGAERDVRRQLGLPAGQRLVVMVGMLVPWKGQGQFIEAVARMSLPDDVTCLIVGGTPERGDPSYAEILRKKVPALGLSNRVIFMGRVDDLVSLLPQFDVVVSASTSPEPLGLVMLEALAAGRIFVGPAHGAVPEIVRAGSEGFLYQPNDVVSMAQQLEQALKACRPAQVGPSVQEMADDFSARFAPRRCATETMRVYNSVLGL